jgi:hypothetical protein
VLGLYHNVSQELGWGAGCPQAHHGEGQLGLAVLLMGQVASSYGPPGAWAGRSSVSPLGLNKAALCKSWLSPASTAFAHRH